MNPSLFHVCVHPTTHHPPLFLSLLQWTITAATTTATTTAATTVPCCSNWVKFSLGNFTGFYSCYIVHQQLIMFLNGGRGSVGEQLGNFTPPIGGFTKGRQSIFKDGIFFPRPIATGYFRFGRGHVAVVRGQCF
jgi:hypothetical protein